MSGALTEEMKDEMEDEEVDGVDDHIELDACSESNDDGGEHYEMEPAIAEEDLLKDGKEDEPEHDVKMERQGRRDISSDRKPEMKDDFADSELDTDASDVDESDRNSDAEAEERELLSMPPLTKVLSDVSHLTTERRLIIHSLEYSELNHPVVNEIAARDTTEEMKFNFIRPKERQQVWSGIVMIHFTSGTAAKVAAEELKSIREDLVVKSDAKTCDHPKAYIDNWVKNEKTQKRWADTILYIKNIAESVTVEQLKEIFCDAEDVVFAKGESRGKDGKKMRMAYAVYRTADLATTAARYHSSSSIEIDGSTLKIYRYVIPVDKPLRGLLKLFERRVVLKYLEKLTEHLDIAEAEGQKPYDWVDKRLKACKKVIEDDDKCRTDVGLPTPSLDDLRLNLGVRVVRSSKRRAILVKLGVIEEKRRSNWNRGSSGNHSSSDRRRNYGQSSSSSTGRSLLGNPPSLMSMNMARPMHLTDMFTSQSDLAFVARQLMGGEPAAKMLRLDASGNFHIDADRDRHRGRNDRDDRSRSSRSGGGSSRYDRR